MSLVAEWCPACRQEILPVDHRCVFCKGQTVAIEKGVNVCGIVGCHESVQDDGLCGKHAKKLRSALRSEPTRKETPPVPNTPAALDVRCKTPGCAEPAEDLMGPYAKLCAAHKDEARRRRNGEAPARKPGDELTLAEKVKQLGKLGKKADALVVKAAKLDEQAAAARREAQRAKRNFRALAQELIGGEAV